jgi:hypothetical protein
MGLRVGLDAVEKAANGTRAFRPVACRYTDRVIPTTWPVTNLLQFFITELKNCRHVLHTRTFLQQPPLRRSSQHT